MQGQYLTVPSYGGEIEEVPNPEWYIIMDICENNHLSMCVALWAYDIFRNYKIYASHRLKPINIIAYSVYVALIKLEIPRIPQEVEQLCGVPPGTVAKIEKASGIGILPPPPRMYTTIFCERLNIAYKHTLTIKMSVDSNVKLRMVRPQCLNAVEIWSYVLSNNLAISLREVSQACCVSENTIKKMYRKIKTP